MAANTYIITEHAQNIVDAYKYIKDGTHREEATDAHTPRPNFAKVFWFTLSIYNGQTMGKRE